MDKIKIGLVILLILAIGYISVEKYNEYRTKELSSAYKVGVEDTITAVIYNLNNCKVLTLNSGNTTMNVVDTSCIKENK